MSTFREYLELNESGDVATNKRVGIQHFNAMKPVEFVTWANSIKKEFKGVLKNIKTALKVDGFNCLHHDTRINTLEHGEMTIGEIVENRIDCHVKSWNGSEIVFERVIGTQSLEDGGEWYEIETAGGNLLKVTGNHYVFLKNQNCWCRVENLKEGDELIFDSNRGLDYV